jgi:hypothetical protein
MIWDLTEERIKGFEYANEPERLQVPEPKHWVFEGRHTNHDIRVTPAGLVCDCAAFWRSCEIPYGGWCRHTIAAERILERRSAITLPVRVDSPQPACA